MRNKSFITFLITFIVCYLGLQLLSKILIARQDEIDTKETRIIQENIRDRFNLFLKVPVSVGFISAELFSREKDLLKRKYTQAATTVRQINPEILGINVVNLDGEIIRVFPAEKNPSTIGKVSQQYPLLKESYQKGEKYFFSPPFKLYQGFAGFAFYFPIVTSEQLRGWVAMVINSEDFFKKFKLYELTSVYNLIIKDKKTNLNYFASSGAPGPDTKVYETVVNQMGREIIFQSWRVDGTSFVLFPQYGNLLIALFMALVAAFMNKLQEQKKKARAQLADISGLLTLTSKEALSNLVDIHDEISKSEKLTGEGPYLRNINYITNLIEQIDLLQTMAQSREGAHFETNPFLPLLENQLHLLEEILAKKDLHIIYKKENLANVIIHANGWLIQNSVLANILSHCVIYAQPGSMILIENKGSEDDNVITFHIQKVHHKGPESNSLSLDRRMEVARRILHIYQGELYIQNDLDEGMIIRIKLPLE